MRLVCFWRRDAATAHLLPGRYSSDVHSSHCLVCRSLWLMLRRVYYYKIWMNLLYSVLYGWLAWGSVLAVVAAYSPSTRKDITVAWYATGAPLAILYIVLAGAR